MAHDSICSACGSSTDRSDAETKPHHEHHFFSELAKAFGKMCALCGSPEGDVKSEIPSPPKELSAELSREVKLYLAGPEVFLPNAEENARMQQELCKTYGFIGLHPMDNNLDISDNLYDTGVTIYRGNIAQIRGCDIVVANCNPFRGSLMDDGTAYELGFGNALQKPSYGYITDRSTYNQRMTVDRQVFFLPSHRRAAYIDGKNYMVKDDFGTFINFMMQCGMTEHGGRVIHGSFEDCLKAIREDISHGILKLT